MRKSPLFAAYIALAAVCFFWGTTYIGIRMALEAFPPLTLVAARYLFSGGLMLAGAKATGAKFPHSSELWRTALFGVMVLGIGNGALAFAELLIPSGQAAMILTTAPFWMVGIDALLPNGAKLHGPTLAAMGVGLAGVLLLVAPGAAQGGVSSNVFKGFLILQVGCFSWTLGSLLQKRSPSRAHPIVVGAVQQAAAGIAFAIPALVAWQPVRWSPRGFGALIYLVFFGSIIGYSAFIFAMDRLPVAVASIYTFVNPVVAVCLGWVFYRERFGWREGFAMATIFAGVALVKKFSRGDSIAGGSANHAGTLDSAGGRRTDVGTSNKTA